MSNFYGKKLSIASFNYRPYVVIEGGLMDGTEMRLGLEYAKSINSTVQIIGDEGNEWGLIHENGTGNGILGKLVEDKADIGYGALYSWFHEYGFLDLSLPVVRSGITCLTPAPRLFTSWLTTVTPFTGYVWAGLLLVNSVIVIAFKFILKFNHQIHNLKNKKQNYDTSKNNSKFVWNLENNNADKNYSTIEAILLILGLNVLQPFPNSLTYSGSGFKHLMLWILILALLITCSYSSGLATSLTIPRFEASIKTVQDLVDFKMEWGGTHDAWIFSILAATQPLIIQTVRQFRARSGSELHSLANTRNYSFSIERLPFGHFAIGTYLTEEDVTKFQVMSEDIYWEYCVFMMRKSSPHLEGINRLIGYMHASGLMYYWEGEVSRKFMNNKVQFSVSLSEKTNQQTDNSSPVQLRTSHLKGLYILWLFGITISTIIFGFEIMKNFFNEKIKRNNIIHNQSYTSNQLIVV